MAKHCMYDSYTWLKQKRLCGISVSLQEVFAAAYKMSMFGMFQHPPTQRGLFLTSPPKPFLAIIKPSQATFFSQNLFHPKTKSLSMELIIFVYRHLPIQLFHILPVIGVGALWKQSSPHQMGVSHSNWSNSCSVLMWKLEEDADISKKFM